MVSYLTSLLKSVQIPISLWQGLPIRMRSSKVQYSLDWLFNNKHPCEWKSQKQLINMLVLRIRYIPLFFMRYLFSINYIMYPLPSTHFLLPCIIIVISLLSWAPGSTIKILWTEIPQFVMHWNLSASQRLWIKHIIEVFLCQNFIHSHKLGNRERARAMVFQLKLKH